MEDDDDAKMHQANISTNKFPNPLFKRPHIGQKVLAVAEYQVKVSKFLQKSHPNGETCAKIIWAHADDMHRTLLTTDDRAKVLTEIIEKYDIVQTPKKYSSKNVALYIM